jgi:predicted DNA-binding transcriptional regulator YafY
MRADRLLSIMLLLQTRRTMTAQDLAGELEVSVRTIYRDMDALSSAGVPVYTQRGPGGGCALLDSYRTTLTGLTRSELRALFMLSVPAPLAELGVDQDLKAALLKLSASLPGASRADSQQVRQRIHLDLASGFGEDEAVPHLRTLQQAVWQERRLLLTYQLPFDTQAVWSIEPYGLVAGGGVWYLVCKRGKHVRVLRVSRVLEVQVLKQHVERPADFDLVATWQAWSEREAVNHSRYRAKARVAPDLLPWLPRFLGRQMDQVLIDTESAGAGGWPVVNLTFASLEEARRHILGFGGAMEVLEPRALRYSVADFARQTVARYDDRLD